MNIKTRLYFWKAKYRFIKHTILGNILIQKYHFRHWFFSWNQDEEGDIVFSVAKKIHFIKYKEHTQVKFGKMNYQPAPKYVCGE